jgi:hypothetical protein
MTEIILKSDLDSSKLKALLAFLKSWGIEAEIKNKRTNEVKKNTKFSLSAGMWSDYDLDSNTLRQEAWQRK